MGFLRGLFGKLIPERAAPEAAPAEEKKLPPRTGSEEALVDGLRVDPRARYVELTDLERTASGPGFERLRIAGIPHWADAIAKRRNPGEPPLAKDEQIDPAFDEQASISAAPEIRLALGPSVRAACLEALQHAPAVRLGEGFVEAIVPVSKAGQRAVQEAVLSVARSFTGSREPRARIARWALEEQSEQARLVCLLWVARNDKDNPRTAALIKQSLTHVADDATRLELAAIAGSRVEIEQLAEGPHVKPEVRARAIAMLPSVCDDEARLDKLLLTGVASAPAEVRISALETILAGRRVQLVPSLVLLLHHGKLVGDVIIRLGDARSALAALTNARKNEDAAVTLERIRVAAELGGKDVVEPLRTFLSAGNPRELATPVRNAIEKVKSRLTAVDGGLSIAATDARGQLSPAASGGELSDSTGAGALSDANIKRPMK